MKFILERRLEADCKRNLGADGHVLSFLGKFLMAKKRDLGGLCKKSLSISFYLQNVPMDSKTRNWRENFNEF